MTALDIFVDHETGPLASPRLEVRFPVLGDVDLAAVTPVFQSLVAEPTDELLVDVTSYAHVRGGPGVLLIGQDAHYGLTDGPTATLSRTHRRPWAGHVAERLAVSLDRTLRLGQKLTSTFDHLALRTDVVTIAVLDRLRAPNTRTTFERVRPALHSFVTRLWGFEPRLSPASVDGAPFSVTARVDVAPSVEELRARLAKLHAS